MSINDFFVGGRPKKDNEKTYKLTEPLIKFRRVNKKAVPQTDQYGSVRDTDASKAARKMAKRIITSKELESGKNINGTTPVRFTMIETKSVVGNDGKKHFRKSHIDYDASVVLLPKNKAVKVIKRKNGSTQKIEQRYKITVKQAFKERLNKPHKVAKKKTSPKKNNVKSPEDEEIDELIKTINQINKSINSKKNNNGSKKNNNGSKKNNNGPKMNNNGSKKNNNGSKMNNNSSKMNNNGSKMNNNGSKKNSYNLKGGWYL